MNFSISLFQNVLESQGTYRRREGMFGEIPLIPKKITPKLVKAAPKIEAVPVFFTSGKKHFPLFPSKIMPSRRRQQERHSCSYEEYRQIYAKLDWINHGVKPI